MGFIGCSAMVNLNIPETVTNIGRDAFSYCESLTSVYLPDNITVINDYLFSDARSLVSVRLPPNLVGIGVGAFEYTALIHIDIPETLQYFGSFAFRESSLESIVLPSNFSDGISDYAFYGCVNLTEVTIPDSVLYIGTLSFYYCHHLQCFYWNASIARDIMPSAFDSGVPPPVCLTTAPSAVPSSAPTMVLLNPTASPTAVDSTCYWSAEEEGCGGSLQEVVVSSAVTNSDPVSGTSSSVRVQKTYRKRV